MQHWCALRRRRNITTDTFQFWFVETAGMVRLERHVLNDKVPQQTPFHFLSLSSMIVVSQNHFDMRQRTEHEISSRRGDPSMCWMGSGSAL